MDNPHDGSHIAAIGILILILCFIGSMKGDTK